MRGRIQRALTASKVSTVVGIGLTTHGIAADRDISYEAGFVLLLVGVAGLVDTRSRINTQKLIEHATEVAKLSEQERQRFAEMGWKAARLSAIPEPRNAAGAEILEMPTCRTSEMRRGGSA